MRCNSNAASVPDVTKLYATLEEFESRRTGREAKGEVEERGGGGAREEKENRKRE